MKCGWDEAISDTHAQQWTKWLTELHLLSDFEVSRCFKAPMFEVPVSFQLHHFADASESGHGTVSYLLLKNSRNVLHCSFVLGKARVAPIKPVTIPRMELTAAVMAVRIDKMLQAEIEFPLKHTIFWTDSTVVLKYLHCKTACFRTFVANRITTIRENSEISQWRYANSILNPADQASRGVPVNEFLKNKDWIFGPSFLKQSVKQWPTMPDDVSQMDSEDPEMKSGTTVAVITSTEDPIEQLLSHYSSWFKLKKAVAWILNVKEFLRCLAQERKDEKTCKDLPSDQQPNHLKKE